MRSLGWLAEQLPEAGLTATIDGIGNVLGTTTKSGSKLLAGSHLENQNFAGWLDGPLGVVYALEAARVINPDPGVKGAVEVAAWCDEEGHFGHFLGSRSYVGSVTDVDVDAARDRTSGRTMSLIEMNVGLHEPAADKLTGSIIRRTVHAEARLDRDDAPILYSDVGELA
jgi:beta-ureidopropionase / N-carbamoyl-L-amino-acid hydrolase